MIELIEEISYEKLEKLLDFLPQPSSAEIAIFGYFDYSSLNEQANELVSGLEFKMPNESLTFEIHNPSKDLVSRLYIHTKESNNPEYFKEENWKRLQLMSLKWRTDDLYLEYKMHDPFDIKYECHEDKRPRLFNRYILPFLSKLGFAYSNTPSLDNLTNFLDKLGLSYTCTITKSSGRTCTLTKE